MSRIKTRHPGIYYRLDAQGRRRYIVWFKDSAGQERFETLPLGSTEKDAVAYRAHVHTTMNRGGLVVRSDMTVDRLATEWLASKKVGQATYDGYKWATDRITKKLGNRRVSDLTTDGVAVFIRHLEDDGLGAASIRKILTVLNQMYSFAVRRKGIVQVNPVAGLVRDEKPKGDQRPMRIVSTAEIAKLLAVSAESKKRLWRFLLFSGLRISEACDLEWGDVDFETGLLTVRGTKTEAAERTVALPAFLMTQLKAQKIACPPGCQYVFHVDGKRLNRRTTLRSLARACKRAGIEGVTQHELRHTYASILIGQGMDVTYVAHQMGHSDPGVTLRTYAKLFDPKSRMAEAQTKLEAAFGS